MTSVNSHSITFRGSRAASGPLTWGQQWIWEEVTHFGQHHNELNFFVVSRVGARTPLCQVYRGLQELVERHEVLRTNFITSGSSSTRQSVRPEGQFTVEIVEDPDEGDAKASEFLSQIVRRPFFFEEELPVRFTVICHDGIPMKVILVFSHIAADAWSATSMAVELEELMDPASRVWTEAESRTRPQALDRAYWEVSAQGFSRSDRAIAFAARQLSEFPEGMLKWCSADREDPPIQDITMGSIALRVALRRISLDYQITESDALLFCVCACLAELQQNEVCGLMLYASNRYGAMRNPSLGTLVQDVPVAIPIRDDSLPGALNRTVWTARAAYFFGQYSPHSMRRLTGFSSARRSGGPDMSCSLNMHLSNTSPVILGDLERWSSSDSAARLQGKTWVRRTKGQACDRAGRQFYLACGTAGDRVKLTLKVDTESISVGAAESFLRELEDRAIYYSGLR